MQIRNVWPICFAIMLSACAHVEIPETEGCVVAGVLAAGADCATTAGVTREMTVDEFITWLEPNEERGAAVCQSAADYVKIKIALEQACEILKTRCTKKMRRELKRLSMLLNGMDAQSRMHYQQYKSMRE